MFARIQIILLKAKAPAYRKRFWAEHWHA